jgi:hypothetical protein
MPRSARSTPDHLTPITAIGRKGTLGPGEPQRAPEHRDPAPPVTGGGHRPAVARPTWRRRQRRDSRGAGRADAPLDHLVDEHRQARLGPPGRTAAGRNGRRPPIDGWCQRCSSGTAAGRPDRPESGADAHASHFSASHFRGAHGEHGDHGTRPAPLGSGAGRRSPRRWSWWGRRSPEAVRPRSTDPEAATSSAGETEAISDLRTIGASGTLHSDLSDEGRLMASPRRRLPAGLRADRPPRIARNRPVRDGPGGRPHSVPRLAARFALSQVAGGPARPTRPDSHQVGLSLGVRMPGRRPMGDFQ